MQRALVAAVLAIVAGAGAPAFAQSVAVPRPKTVEISGGVTFVGGYDFGASNAELTPNVGHVTGLRRIQDDESAEAGTRLAGAHRIRHYARAGR